MSPSAQDFALVSPMTLLSAMIVSLFPLSLPDTQSALWSAPHAVGLITHGELDELSGLEAAQGDSELFWAHNDSGDRARLFLIDRGGAVQGEVELEGTRVKDAEDMSAGPCSPAQLDRRCLFLADTGDNRHVRRTVAIYSYLEPDLSAGPIPESLAPYRVIHLEHPSGRPHDVEAILSHPKQGSLWLVEKSRSGPSRVLRVPDEALLDDATSPEEPASLEVVASLNLEHDSPSGRLITAATFDQSGRCMILRTYLEVLTYCLDEAERSWERALKRSPDRLVAPDMLQGEAVAIDAHDGSLWLASEGVFSPLVRISRRRHGKALK